MEIYAGGIMALEKGWLSKLYTGVCDFPAGGYPPKGEVPLSQLHITARAFPECIATSSREK